MPVSLGSFRRMEKGRRECRMKCKIEPLPPFVQQAKRLRKRYPSFEKDFAKFLQELEKNPMQGARLEHNMRKVRMAITSKGKGKSGGARVITAVAIISVEETEVKLLYIYDKSDWDTISEAKLEELWNEWINKKYNRLMEEKAKYEVNVTPEMEELLRQINALPIDERQELLDILTDNIEDEDDAEWEAKMAQREAGTMPVRSHD